jgi:phage-related protein
MAAHAIAAGAYQVAMMAVHGVTNLVVKAEAALNAVMSANPIGVIVVAIAALAAGLIYLWNTSDGFRSFVTELFEGVSEWLSEAVDTIVEFFTETIPEAFSEFMEGAGEVITAIEEFFTVTIPELFVGAITAVGDFIVAVVEFFT